MFGRLSARWPTTKICNSGAAKNTADQFLWPSKRSCIHVVRNGLDLRQFRREPVPRNGVSVLAAGRLFPEKRWDRLLRCVELLSSRGLKFTLRLAGDGPLRTALESQSLNLLKTGQVEFLGPRDDIPTLLANSSFLVHTPDAEGCPNIVMEAMACGRAVVATDAGDVPSLVENGKTGFVVNRGDDAALVEAIASLITDRTLCSQMGEAARIKAEQDFGLERLVVETLAAYRAAGWRDS